MTPVHCAGCGRTVALTTSAQLRNRVYCAAWCAADYPAGPKEDRDALMTELSRLGRTDQRIADLFGVSRARVQHVVASRV